MYDIDNISVTELSPTEMLIKFSAMRETRTVFAGDLIDPPEYGPEMHWGALIIETDTTPQTNEELIQLIEDNEEWIDCWTRDKDLINYLVY